MTGQEWDEAAHTRSSDWTIATYAAHNEALRAAQDKFEAERDRRYAEVATEREKALKIKETADLAALGLAREIQTYKDEKANELREQINQERGHYATKDDLRAATERIDETLKPIVGYVATQQGRAESSREGRARSEWTIERVLSVAVILLGALYFVLNYRPPT